MYIYHREKQKNKIMKANNTQVEAFCRTLQKRFHRLCDNCYTVSEALESIEDRMNDYLNRWETTSAQRKLITSTFELLDR